MREGEKERSGQFLGKVSSRANRFPYIGDIFPPRPTRSSPRQLDLPPALAADSVAPVYRSAVNVSPLCIVNDLPTAAAAAPRPAHLGGKCFPTVKWCLVAMFTIRSQCAQRERERVFPLQKILVFEGNKGRSKL